MKLEKKNDSVVAYLCYYCVCIIAGILFYRLDFVWNIYAFFETGKVLHIAVQLLMVFISLLPTFSIVYLCVFIVVRCARLKLNGSFSLFTLGAVVCFISFMLTFFIDFCVVMTTMD